MCSLWGSGSGLAAGPDPPLFCIIMLTDPFVCGGVWLVSGRVGRAPFSMLDGDFLLANKFSGINTQGPRELVERPCLGHANPAFYPGDRVAVNA